MSCDVREVMEGLENEAELTSGQETYASQWFESQMADFYNTGIQKLVPWYEKLPYVYISEVYMLKNSSTLAVSVPINLSIKFGFVFVNSPRETYFVDTLHIT